MTVELRGLAALGVGIAVLLGGCTAPPTNPISTATTSVDFPYPPVHNTFEIAVPLSPDLSEAAQFAMQAFHISTLASTNQPESVRRYEAIIAEELKRQDDSVPKAVPPSTGGRTYRAVRASPQEGGDVVIDVCVYNVPGIYVLGRDGKTLTPLSNPHAFTLSRMTVEKTTRRSADGAQPATPRWLVVKDWIKGGPDANEADRVCSPFKPDPWIQKMPVATTPAPK